MSRRQPSPGLLAGREAAKARFYAALGDDQAAIRYEALAALHPARAEEYLQRAEESRSSARRNRMGTIRMGRGA